MTARTYLNLDGQPIAHEIDDEELSRDNEGLNDEVNVNDLDDIFVEETEESNSDLFDISDLEDLDDFGNFTQFENIKSAVEPGRSDVEEIKKHEEVVKSTDDSDDDDDDFDFDSIFEDKNKEVRANEDEIKVDLSKYENIEDGGSNLVLAIARGERLAYLAHGTAYRLKPLIDFLNRAIGAKLVVIERGEEDIEALKRDAFAFDSYYKSYIMN